MSYSASPAPQAKLAPARVAASQPKVPSSTKAGSSSGSRESLGRVEELTTQVRIILREVFVALLCCAGNES